jgi:hypothetical protein
LPTRCWVFNGVLSSPGAIHIYAHQLMLYTFGFDSKNKLRMWAGRSPGCTRFHRLFFLVFQPRHLGSN